MDCADPPAGTDKPGLELIRDPEGNEFCLGNEAPH
jgi:hypothetical protein